MWKIDKRTLITKLDKENKDIDYLSWDVFVKFKIINKMNDS